MRKRIVITISLFMGLLLMLAYSWGVSGPDPVMPTVEQLQSDYFEVADPRFQAKLLYTYQWTGVYGTAGHFVSLSDSVLISKGGDAIGYHTPEENTIIIKKKNGDITGIVESKDGNIIMILNLGFDNQRAVYKITGPFLGQAKVGDYSAY